MARPQKKPDYDAENLMKQLIDEVAEAYLHPGENFREKTGGCRWTPWEMNFPCRP